MLYGTVQHSKIWLRFMACLNPYFFGKCSTATVLESDTLFSDLGLNPYFFGKCSTALKGMIQLVNEANGVLILIFLENALRQWKNNCDSREFQKVLILIFLENALRREGSISIELSM